MFELIDSLEPDRLPWILQLAVTIYFPEERALNGHWNSRISYSIDSLRGPSSNTLFALCYCGTPRPLIQE
uniref:Uncharacterized protein n=1 Tax=Steinernema glaseri TaxID=37863 RepID=A0A1I7ZNN4_9BILA